MTLVKRMAAFGVAVVIGSGFYTLPAQAGYIVTLEQQGTSVVATGSGPIDLTGLSFDSNVGVNALIFPSVGAIRTGPLLSDDETIFIDRYTGPTGPTSFGSGMIAAANSGNGDEVGIVGSQPGGAVLDVPQGYVSGFPLFDTATYNNATFNSLGVTPGTYEWTWGTGANQNFTLVIGSAAVPEPSSLLSLGVGVAALFLVSAYRRIVPKISMSYYRPRHA